MVDPFVGLRGHVLTLRVGPCGGMVDPFVGLRGPCADPMC